MIVVRSLAHPCENKRHKFLKLESRNEFQADCRQASGAVLLLLPLLLDLAVLHCQRHESRDLLEKDQVERTLDSGSSSPDAERPKAAPQSAHGKHRIRFNPAVPQCAQSAGEPRLSAKIGNGQWLLVLPCPTFRRFPGKR